MRKVCATLVSTAVFMLVLSFSHGEERPFALDKKAADKLNPTAAKTYQRAVKRLDRIDYLGALELYIKIQAEDPEHAEIRFLVGDLAIREARKRMGNESLELLGKARQACQEVLDLKSKGAPIRRPEVRRSTNALKQIEDLVASQDKRDQDRSRIGKAVVDNYVKETAEPTTEEKGKEGEKGEKGEKGGKEGKGGSTAKSGSRPSSGGTARVRGES